MSRKRILLLAALPVAALAATGAALAGGGPNAQTASATFSATTVSHARLTTCTVGSGDTFATTIATYKGTATSSDARLDGPFTIRAASLLDTNTGIGRLVGIYRINAGTGTHARGSFNAAVANGNATGLALGRLIGPNARLVATLDTPFDPADGFGVSSPGSIGTGSAAGIGVAMSGPVCHQWHRHPLRWLRRHLHRHR